MPTKTDNKSLWLAKRILFNIRNNDLVYKRLLNRRYSYKNLIGSRVQSSVELQVLRDLETEGISIKSLHDIVPNFDFFQLESWINANEVNLKQKSKKKFLQSYYGSESADKPLDFGNPFVNFYLSEEILRIVVQYLGYVPQLYEVYVEKTLPVGEAEPTHSQNWHRDPEEKRTLKVFLYMSDVSVNSGPFTYLKGSAPTVKGRYSRVFKQKLPLGSYPAEEEVLKIAQSEDLVVATGKKGTVIFCDTAGLHKGGHAKSEHRIMSTAFFPSKYWSEPRLFQVDLAEKSNRKLNPLAQAVLD